MENEEVILSEIEQLSAALSAGIPYVPTVFPTVGAGGHPFMGYSRVPLVDRCVADVRPKKNAARTSQTLPGLVKRLKDFLPAHLPPELRPHLYQQSKHVNFI